MQEQFAAAATTYDDAAVLAAEVGRRMAERLDVIRLVPGCFADIGCATGTGMRALQTRYPQALPLALDYARPMLDEVRRRSPLLQRLRGRGPRLINADVRALPLRPRSVDLIWSNLMLHWLDDPLPAFREMHRTLATNGLLMFSMLGPDTLRELRAAATACGIVPPLRRFHDMHDIGDMLVAAGFADPVMDMEMITLTYRSPRSLLRDQRHLGVRDGLLGALPWRQWRRIFTVWQSAGSPLPACFEIVYGHAWKAPPKVTEDGRSVIRFHKTG
ncbi:MAG: methyltransferase domain-containing protein [Proteobacteria bacterium]|nr:methyltransferase domain-containing protein [Pseudomonadota bacterium]HQR04191.1 methyltransferase domain-containing protein [Rhodocyclaceae bacterium]